MVCLTVIVENINIQNGGPARRRPGWRGSEAVATGGAAPLFAIGDIWLGGGYPALKGVFGVNEGSVVMSILEWRSCG